MVEMEDAVLAGIVLEEIWTLFLKMSRSVKVPCISIEGLTGYGKRGIRR
jgi:hypothetical protein